MNNMNQRGFGASQSSFAGSAGSSSGSNSNTYNREQYELNESSITFILQNSVRLNSEVVFLNGVTLHSFGNYIDYQISDNTLTLTFIPDIGDILLISYVIDE